MNSVATIVIAASFGNEKRTAISFHHGHTAALYIRRYPRGQRRHNQKENHPVCAQVKDAARHFVHWRSHPSLL
jgi:hypothetical protein